MFAAKVNNNRNRINIYWVRKQNRIRNKLQMVSNQSYLNMIEKIQLFQIWRRFDFFFFNIKWKIKVVLTAYLNLGNHSSPWPETL